MSLENRANLLEETADASNAVRRNYPRNRKDFEGNVVRPTGFEPAAFRVGAERSIQLSYGRIFNFCRKIAGLTGVAHGLGKP